MRFFGFIVLCSFVLLFTANFPAQTNPQPASPLDATSCGVVYDALATKNKDFRLTDKFTGETI